ncbi:hypothetical protein LCGC14_1942160 [marine sediment metagenome]|uniref:Uncharacterized protein n=1 Tax=marine sediment metagenome TaxID=412755 RepID=A0A0F9IH45_9ZZZZ
MTPRKIRTKFDNDHKFIQQPAVLGGWFEGKLTYLWIGGYKNGPCIATLSGHKLYRLAKAIVKAFESKRNNV